MTRWYNEVPHIRHASVTAFPVYGACTSKPRASYKRVACCHATKTTRKASCCTPVTLKSFSSAFLSPNSTGFFFLAYILLSYMSCWDSIEMESCNRLLIGSFTLIKYTSCGSKLFNVSVVNDCLLLSSVPCRDVQYYIIHVLFVFLAVYSLGVW